jgi:hypothetical protein
MSIGTMTLHRFNGDEIYSVESATIEHLRNAEGSFDVTFRAEAGPTPIQTLPDTESLRVQPFAEWTLVLPRVPVLELRPSRTFVIQKGSDEWDDFRTHFYYYEHESMDENEISILERDALRVRARLTGYVTDVNFYDGSKPRTKVDVEADFTIALGI